MWLIFFYYKKSSRVFKTLYNIDLIHWFLIFGSYLHLRSLNTRKQRNFHYIYILSHEIPAKSRHLCFPISNRSTFLLFWQAVSVFWRGHGTNGWHSSIGFCRPRLRSGFCLPGIWTANYSYWPILVPMLVSRNTKGIWVRRR